MSIYTTILQEIPEDPSVVFLFDNFIDNGTFPIENGSRFESRNFGLDTYRRIYSLHAFLNTKKGWF